MTLKNWANNNWLREHITSIQEISQLMGIVNRDIKDSQQSGISNDWKFGIAYNAALKLCTILLYAEGYKPEKKLAHYRTIKAIPLILGDDKQDDADYLDSCRVKRNTIEYDYAGGVTASNAKELVTHVIGFKKEVEIWMQENHPEFVL